MVDLVICCTTCCIGQAYERCLPGADTATVHMDKVRVTVITDPTKLQFDCCIAQADGIDSAQAYIDSLALQVLTSFGYTAPLFA